MKVRYWCVSREHTLEYEDLFLRRAMVFPYLKMGTFLVLDDNVIMFDAKCIFVCVSGTKRVLACREDSTVYILTYRGRGLRNWKFIVSDRDGFDLKCLTGESRSS